MMTIAYYQGALDKYKDHAMITRIIKDSRNCDYIIAPITLSKSRLFFTLFV